MPFLLLFCLSFLACLSAAQFVEHTIASDLKGGYQVVAVDMNHDGKPDLVAVASGMSELVWYENPTWSRHVIAAHLSRMINVAAWDTDGDGVPELILASEFANDAARSAGIVSVLHSNGDPREPWSIREIDRIPTAHRLRWADLEGRGHKVILNAPLTGAQAVPPDYRQAVPLVFYRPGEWKRESIPSANEGVQHGIFVVDWDGRGRDAILTASFSGIHLYRYGKGKWTRQELSRGDPAAWPKSGSSDVAVGKLGARRFLAAIEPWHGNQVAVYRQSGKKWERAVIDNSLVDGHTILTADFDGDGREQIVAGFRGGSKSVFLYRLDAKNVWVKQVVDNGGIPAASCVAVDLDADHRPDLACIGAAVLKWYRNTPGSPQAN